MSWKCPPRQTLTTIRPMGEEILPETLLEQFRASQDRQSRAMVLYRPPTNLVEKMLGRGEPDGKEAEAEGGSPPQGAEKADLAEGSSDENSSGSASNSSAKDADVDMS